MDEVAPVSVDAVVIVFETSAFFGFVFGVVFVVFSELVKAMGEFASFVVGAEAIVHILFAKLGLFLVCLAFSVAFS